jgi:hypothetical protein
MAEAGVRTRQKRHLAPVGDKAKQPVLDLGPKPKWKDQKVRVDHVEFAPFGSPPEPGLIQSVGIYGVLVPVLLEHNGDGPFKVLDGRRRLIAARANELATVQARVLVDGAGTLYDPATTLAGNAHTSPNPVVEYDAIQAIIKAVPGIKPAAIAKGTGIGLKVVNARLKLSALLPELLDGWRNGKFGTKVGETAAKCDAGQQRKLVAILEENGMLTLQDVKDVRKTAVKAHQRTLPGDRVLDRIRERLQDCRRDAFAEWGDTDLTAAIDAALAAVEEHDG